MKLIKINNKAVSVLLRVLIGGVFVASAVLKYMSIDVFDLYVYEHNIFNLGFTETLTRLLVVVEFCLGVMLISGWQFRWAYYASLGLLVVFTIYLVLMPWLFQVDVTNCNCFGDKVVLSRTQSIVKNVVLIILLLLLKVQQGIYGRRALWAAGITAVAALGTVMCLNAPDYLYVRIHNSEVKIDEPLYHAALQVVNKDSSYSQGKQIICMYSTACSYCRKSARRVQLMAQREHWDTKQIKLIFWNIQGEKAIQNFFTEQHLDQMEYTSFAVDTFLTVTQGQQPVILLSDNGKIVKSMDYIAFNEADVNAFLNE